VHEIILRIFFSGLMAFVPSKDGKELTVLVVSAPHGARLADGNELTHHTPILLVRAGKCEPAPCPARDPKIGKFLFGGPTAERAGASLARAVSGGGAWLLGSSDLSLPGATAELEISATRKSTASGAPDVVPHTPKEREDFSWVPRLSAIAPGIGRIKPELLGDHPPASLIAARLRLRSGRVITYSVIPVDKKVRPIRFNTAPGAPDAPFTQALANWVEAEVRIQGDAVELVDTNFETGAQRTFKFAPQNNLVEMAILNFPPLVHLAPDVSRPVPKRGQHFEVYYDLVTNPPAPGQRPVPEVGDMKPSDPQVDWIPLHSNEPVSPLLDALSMSPRGKRKSPYDITLCPGSQIP